MAKPISVQIVGDYKDTDIKRAIADLNKLQASGMTTAARMGAVGESMATVGKKMTVGLTLPIVAGGIALVGFAKGAEEAEIANRKLDNVLTSMGYGEASARVSAYAEELERNLAVDADLIKAAQTKLATFKNLTATVNEVGGAFDRATMATLDLAAAGFGTAETNAVQLGKALQDPVKGITALARAGVTFTESEKAKIKTLVESNKTLEAQDLILSAIEKQVGGTAAAGVSSFDKLRLSLLQIADAIGAAVLPFIQQLADFVSNTLVPVVVPFVTRLSAAFQALPRPIKAVAAGLVILAAAAGPVIFAVGKMMTAYAAASTRMAAANTFLRTSFVTTWASMKASVSAAVMQIKASMIATQTQAGALAAGVRTAGTIAITSFKGMAVAAKGLLISLGPIGLGLLAVTAVYDVMSGGASKAAGSVDSLTEALKQQGEAGKKAAAELLADQLYEKNRFQLEALGLSYEETVAAITGGADAMAAFTAKVEAQRVAMGESTAVSDSFLSYINEYATNYDRASAAAAESADRSRQAYDAMGLTADGAGAAGGAVDGFGNSLEGAAGEASALATETKKLSDLFTSMDANIAAIRARDEFTKMLKGMDDAIESNNKSLFRNGKAAMDNREVVLDALEKGKQDAIAWGEANGATLAQVEARFKSNTEAIRKELQGQGFKKKDLEKFFGSDYVDAAGVSVQGQMVGTFGTLADRLGPVALREMKGVGRDIGTGIAIGVSETAPKIDIETKRAVNNAEKAARDAAESNSPSKLFERVGKDLMKGLGKGVEDESDKVAQKAKRAIEKAVEAANEAMQRFNDYRKSVSDSIVGLLSLGEAYDNYTARQQAVTDTLTALMEHQASIQGESTDEQKTKLAELQAAYRNAQADAAKGAQSIVDEFINQGRQLSAFNANLQTLLKAGLSKQAFDAIVAEGKERGAAIAAALVEGNVAENARRVSQVYESVQIMGETTGQMAAATFESTGVKLAIKTLEGLIKEFMPTGKKRKELLAAIKSLNDAIKFEPKYLDIVTRYSTQGGPPSSEMQVSTSQAQSELAAGLASSGFDWSSLSNMSFGSDWGGFPMFGDGGIVTGPTFGLIGEAGPEAIIPLSRAGEIGGNTYNLTINAGMGTDPYEMGRIVVDAVKKYERVSGSVWVSA